MDELRLYPDNLYFTSDLHFGHENIIGYCQRPFQGIAEMNRVLIDRWNLIVPPDGATVFILGDFFWTLDSAKEIIRELHGDKILIYGNHDRRCLKDEWFCRQFRRIDDMLLLSIKYPDKTSRRKMHLSHFPMLQWENSRHGSYHLHGHTHGTLRSVLGTRRFDVGTDCHDFRPISAMEIREKMRRLY